MKLPKDLSIYEIATLVGGTTECKQDIKVNAISLSPLLAQAGQVAFLFDPKLLAKIDECHASIKIIPKDTKCETPCIYVDRPLLAVQKILTLFQVKRYYPETGIHPTAIVDPSCEISDEVAIGPYVVIGPKTKIGKKARIMAGCIIGACVEIGDDCLLYPGCLIADYVKMGNRVILQQGATLGSDGFAYVNKEESNLERRMRGDFNLVYQSNPHLKIPQIGTVILEDDVEIGSCTTIDRATMGATIIGRGTKIDNQVMIAHNCKIGEEVLIVSQVAVAGSCLIGDRAIIAGQAGVKDHAEVKHDAIVQGQAGVMKDVGVGGIVAGTPAIPTREYMGQMAYLKKLPKMYDQLKELKKQVAELEQLLKQTQSTN